MTTDELSEKLLDFAARMNNKRFKVIACNVMWRELSHFAALSPHAFNLQFMDWGLHTEPDRSSSANRPGGKRTARGRDGRTGLDKATHSSADTKGQFSGTL